MQQGRSLKKAKAERAAKKRRARRRKRAIVLVVEIVILFLLLGIGYVMSKYGKFQLNIFGDNEIIYEKDAENEAYTTIALFGCDSREGELEEGTHADTVMIVSIDNKSKEVRLVSVYRDLISRQQNNELGKVNSAYFRGGPKEAINMLNENYDLAIKDYVTVDFGAFVEVVDLLGGIDADVSEEEALEMNNHIYESAEVVGKTANEVKSGFQHLDGVQTITYARIRKNVGGDYARTERQQYVIGELVKKIKETDLATINQIIDSVFERISTSFTLSEIMKLASGVLKYELGESNSFAFEYTDGTIEGIGSVVIPLGVTENVQELHAFLYPGETYTPSETVKEIASEIEGITGKTRADYVEQNPPQTSDE